MSKLVVLLIIVGAFLGGYYLGRQPETPNLLSWVPGSHATEDETEYDERGAARPVAVEVGGETYIIGRRYDTEFGRQRR